MTLMDEIDASQQIRTHVMRGSTSQNRFISHTRDSLASDWSTDENNNKSTHTCIRDSYDTRHLNYSSGVGQATYSTQAKLLLIPKLKEFLVR